MVGRADKVNAQVDRSKEIIFKSLDLILEREGVIEHLVEETENLETSVRSKLCAPPESHPAPFHPRDTGGGCGLACYCVNRA